MTIWRVEWRDPLPEVADNETHQDCTDFAEAFLVREMIESLGQKPRMTRIYTTGK